MRLVMSGTLILAEAVRFDDTRMWVTLTDGREIGVPLSWFPRLNAVNPDERLKFEISPFGIHWPELDEDISIEGLLQGRGDQGAFGGEAA